jgi:uncharacterized membrane protein YbhN (UPF0104 family)
MKNILSSITAFLFFLPNSVLAQTQGSTGIGTAIKVVEDTAKNNTTYDTSWKLEEVFGFIIFPILTLVGTIFVIFMIYAGYLWMTASGNEQKVDKSKEILRQSLIGLIIVFGAYAIAYFVISIFGSNVNIQ